jgi:arabinogalactan oligomer/maltooligosaccharide transport system permease protein
MSDTRSTKDERYPGVEGRIGRLVGRALFGARSRDEARVVRPTNYVMFSLRVVVIFAALIFALFPVIWIVSASLNPIGSISTQSLIPQNVSSTSELFSNYDRLFDDPAVPFWHWMFNSILVSSIATVAILMITSLSAYSFSRFRFNGRRTVLLGIFIIQVFPNLLAMVAFYLMLLQLGKYIPLIDINTYGGLILIYMGGGMAINIWMMKGFFDTIPNEIDESARVDGATHWQCFVYLIFPLVRPILAVVGILTFIGIYGDVIISLTLLKEKDVQTLAIGLYRFIADQYNQKWGIFSAGALIGAIPIVVIILSFQRFFVSGLTEGAVKG